MAAVDLAQPDVTLLLDMGGVIREVSVSSVLSSEKMDGWLGHAWRDTVPDIGGEKVRRMVEDARDSGISAFRQLTQRFPSGREVPMEYTTVLLGGRTGMLAVGKSLLAVAELQSRFIAAQQSLERDSWKLREIETRYRLLFNHSSEAVLLLRDKSLRIAEANPAAMKVLGLSGAGSQGGAGQDVMPAIPPLERAAFKAMIQRVQDQGKAPGTLLHFGEQRKPWLARASSVRDENGPLLMVQLVPVGPGLAAEPEPALSFEAMDALPDGFVVLAGNGVIHRANRAFAAMVDMGSVRAVVGEALERWIWRPGADVPAILATLREHGVVRLFPSSLNSEHGTALEVELSGGVLPDQEARFGLLIRDVGRRIERSSEPGAKAFVEQFGESVGKVPLRQLIRSTIDGVERHYVRAALDLAGGNRTAAAELLGLSRQSLYMKLGRYGLDEEAQVAGPAIGSAENV